MSQVALQTSPNVVSPTLWNNLDDSIRRGDYFKLKAITSKHDIKAVVNLPSIEGLTFLHWASYYGYYDIALELKYAGAKINLPDSRDGRTPLHWAITGKQPFIIDTLMLAGANSKIRDKSGFTPLHQAISEGHSTGVEILLKHGADATEQYLSGVTPLHLAVLNGFAQIIPKLREKGAKILGNEIEVPSIQQLVRTVYLRDRQTYIIEALKNAHANVKEGVPLIHLAVLLAVLGNPIDVVSMLLNLEPEKNPNLKDINGNTPLYYAAINSRHDLVNILSLAGAKDF